MSRVLPVAFVLFGLFAPTGFADVGVVSLDSSAGWESVEKRQRPGGLLTREFARQAFLIAAREELRLTTRDYWLSDAMPSDRAAPRFDVRFLPDDNVSVEIVILRDGESESLGKFSQSLEEGAYIDAIGDMMEQHSRDGFVEVLRKGGFEGEANEWKESDPLDGEIEQLLQEMTFTSQFHAVRRVHWHIRSEGESPEWLGALVRGYANLGLLTACHWHPAHKVFTARAYLYARRLKHRRPDSSLAAWHLGYAYSLSGMHFRALQTIEAARKNFDESIPPWCELAFAYAKFELAKTDLETVPAEHRQLARMLRCGSLILSTNGSGALDVALVDIEEMPECYRMHDDMAKMAGVGVNHTVTLEAPVALAANIYRRLGEFDDLPAEAREIVKARSKVGDDEGLQSADEYIDRQRMIRVFKSEAVNAHHDEKNMGEPSWAALGNLLQEISFLQSWRRVKFVYSQLGLPPEDILERFDPLYADHPYAEFMRAYTSNREDRLEALAQVAQFNPVSLEIHSTNLIDAAHPPLKDKWFRMIMRNSDAVARDLTFILHGTDVDTLKQNSNTLIVVSPFSPTAQGMLIRYQWDRVKEVAPKWEESNEQFVLLELGRRYGSLGKNEEAARCLKKAIERGHEQNVYRELASIYKRQGKLELWLETLEEFLEQPDFGLEHAGVSKDIAWHFMHQRQFEKALPYAERAARSGSAFGLSVAACCYEALQEWEQAEAMARATTQRYRSSWITWYSFCKRTGHGDLDAARDAAVRGVNELEEKSDEPHAFLGMFYLLDDQPKRALKNYDGLGKEEIDPSYYLHALLLAIELGEDQKRKQAVERLRTLGPKFQPPRTTLISIGELIATDAEREERGRLDAKQIDKLLKECESYDSTSVRYFLGRYHELCEQPEAAERFYREGMTSSSINFGSRTLCGARLSAKDKLPEDYLDNTLSEIGRVYED